MLSPPRVDKIQMRTSCGQTMQQIGPRVKNINAPDRDPDPVMPYENILEPDSIAHGKAHLFNKSLNIYY
jgi:hypothetical protein